MHSFQSQLQIGTNRQSPSLVMQTSFGHNLNTAGRYQCKYIWSLTRKLLELKGQSQIHHFRYENGTVASDIQYDFIDNYCGRDDEMKWGSLEIIRSGSAPQAVFWIESFQFAKFEEAQFKIYCTLSLCVHSLQFCNLPGPDHNLILNQQINLIGDGAK